MARDLNRVTLTGNLGADPESRFTSSGTAYTTFRLAVNSSSGTEWFSILAWDRLAEICRDGLSKGQRVFVEGRLQTRSWEDQNGRPRTRSEIVISELIILQPKKPFSYEEPVGDLPF